ncbi:hypothetical protein BOX15_Mlig022603g1 [Macrostomum lignano]|uniref:RING-type domain-containing protein n=1 Tax=Macrostomum lignano TaxID=282301 RepID=A0A267EIB0_9PLAT|nr:hypothetical protein BOX15_Mlig022603g1 [Macrostomum lignano]
MNSPELLVGTTWQNQSSAKHLQNYLNELERAALSNETNAYYRFKCAAIAQEIGSQCSLFQLEGCRPNQRHRAIIDHLLSMANTAAAPTPDLTVSEATNSSVNNNIPDSKGGIRLCRYMAYYADNAVTGVRERRRVDFSAAEVAAVVSQSYRLPAGLPTACRDMRLEQNRLLTFLSVSAAASSGAGATPVPRQPEDVKAAAAEGLYFTGRVRHPLRCAFCCGSVNFFSSAGESPTQCHSRDRPECPLLLGFNVGNQPIVEALTPTTEPIPTTAAAKKSPIQCTELSGIVNEVNLAMDKRTSGPAERLAYDSARFCGLATECSFSMPSESAAASCLPPLVAARTVSRQASLQSSAWCRGLASDWLAAKSGFHVVDAANDKPLSTAACRCYACGVAFPPSAVLAWSVASNVAGQPPCPWLLHARLSPTCPHLLRERGSAFVSAVAEANFSTLRIVGADNDSPVDICGGGGGGGQLIDATPQRRRLLCGSTLATAALLFRVDRRSPRARADLPAAQLAARLADVADHPQDAEAAIRLQLAFCGDDFASGELQLETAMELRKRADDCGIGRVAALAEDWLAAAQKKRQLAAASVPSRTARLRCRLCGCGEAACCLLPCSHRSLCPACEAQAADCPVCGAEILAICLLNPA